MYAIRTFLSKYSIDWKKYNAKTDEFAAHLKNDKL